jgi:hypothetical protein
MYSVVPFLFVYKCTAHCHRLANQLQLINTISYVLMAVSRFTVKKRQGGRGRGMTYGAEN